MNRNILDAVRAVYEKKPLVHSITNFVVMQVSANALLAAHASPVMAHAAEEMDDLTTIDDALVLNIGTLDPDWLASMELAGSLMKKKGKPVVLDPVGAGASALRTRSALRLLDMVRPDILIVDEILSVGDFKFQEKCKARMSEMLEAGTTLLLVSHSIEDIRNMCTHAAWIDHGEMKQSGEVMEVTEAYLKGV